MKVVLPTVPRIGSPLRALFSDRGLPPVLEAPRPLACAPRILTSSLPVSKRLSSPPEVQDLFDYQADGVCWLRERDIALFADEMGLGKTVQALRALEKGDRAIVVCPAGLRLNWAAETKKWRPDLATRIVKDPALLVPRPGEIAIISYDLLPTPFAKNRLVQDFLGDACVIFDEAHYVKNHTALRTKASAALAAQCGRKWLLTGTPLLGKPLDLFGVLKTGGLVQASFGSFDRFATIFEGSRNKWGAWEFGTRERGKKRVITEKHHAAARECLQRVMLRRTRKEVLPGLPEKIYTDIPVEMPLGVSHVIDHANAQWELYGAEDLPPFEMISEARRVLASAKIPAMLEQVERFEDEEIPLLVFSSHLEPVKALQARKGWGIIAGEITAVQRNDLVKKFQAGKLKGLALTIKAGGVGITLTFGSHLLFVDQEFTPALNAQAEDRAVRIGQEASSVQVLRLVADHPLDRRLTEILATKQRLIAGVVG